MIYWCHRRRMWRQTCCGRHMELRNDTARNILVKLQNSTKFNLLKSGNSWVLLECWIGCLEERTGWREWPGPKADDLVWFWAQLTSQPLPLFHIPSLRPLGTPSLSLMTIAGCGGEIRPEPLTPSFRQSHRKQPRITIPGLGHSHKYCSFFKKKNKKLEGWLRSPELFLAPNSIKRKCQWQS